MVRNKGFTLIELLLVIGFIGTATIGMYTIYQSVYREYKIQQEVRYIDSVLTTLDAATSIFNSYDNVSLANLPQLGVTETSSLGVNSIEPLSGNRIGFVYNNIQSSYCTKFVSKILNRASASRMAAIINSTQLNPGDTIEEIISSCTKGGFSTVDLIITKVHD